MISPSHKRECQNTCLQTLRAVGPLVSREVCKTQIRNILRSLVIYKQNSGDSWKSPQKIIQITAVEL